MNKPGERMEHDELDLLLPWYVNGTLETDEHAKVERHLADCAACQASVELLSQVRNAANSGSPSPIVPKLRVNDLLDAIDRHDTENTSNSRFPAWAIAATVTAVAIGVAFFAFNPAPNTQQLQIFETATTPAASTLVDYVFLVEYEPGTSATQREQFTRGIGGVEIGPGGEPRTYKVSVEFSAGTLEEMDLYTKQLQTRNKVRAVKLIAVQLPVR